MGVAVVFLLATFGYVEAKRFTLEGEGTDSGATADAGKHVAARDHTAEASVAEDKFSYNIDMGLLFMGPEKQPKVVNGIDTSKDEMDEDKEPMHEDNMEER